MRFGRGDVGTSVKVVQEWLCLREFGVLIDGRYGAATEQAVALFQSRVGLPVTGVVGDRTWDSLTEPFRFATAAVPRGGDFGAAVTAAAERHLAARAREVGGQNRGPWVRLYMNGRDGRPFAWCAGFASYCIRQAAASLGVSPPLPRVDSVGELVRAARSKNRLILRPARSSRRAIVRPGSLFVVRSRRRGWAHVGIVTSVNGDVFHTIEGNSNDDLQTNSYEVCRRIRSYEFETKDFIRLT